VERAEPAVKNEHREECFPSAAEKAGPSPTHSSQVAAAEALPPVLQPSHHHDQNFRSVVDELCPDRVYHEAAHPLPLVPDLRSQNIPQLDGQDNVEREWWCSAASMPTEELLHQHHDNPDHMITYEECNICYPWHVWT
jgi:hypothetical protein